MKEVSYQVFIDHEGPMTVGPIPVGVDPREWVKTRGEGESFYVTLYDKPMKLTNGQYEYTQGTYWILKD